MKNMDIFKKTMPYVWTRFGLHLALGIGIIVFYILAFLVIGFSDGLTFISLIILIIGLAIYGAATRYFNYLVKAGHIAVIAELSEKGTLPSGVSVTQYGKEKVKKRFATASVFYALDGLVSGAVSQIQKIVNRVGGLFEKIPAVKMIFDVLNLFIGIVLGYVDEAVLSHIFRHENESAWKGAADGVVLYFESWKDILKNSVGLVIFVIAFYLVGGFGTYILIGALLDLFVATESILIFLVSILGAFLIISAFKASFVDSWITISVVNKYTQVTYNKQPQFDLYGKAKGWSRKFTKICSNAEAEGAVLGSPMVVAGAAMAQPQVQQVPGQVTQPVQQAYVQQPVYNQTPVAPVQQVPVQPVYTQQPVMNQAPVQPQQPVVAPVAPVVPEIPVVAPVQPQVQQSVPVQPSMPVNQTYGQPVQQVPQASVSQQPYQPTQYPNNNGQ